jgi:hypothetical protein
MMGGIHRETQRLIGGISEVRRGDWLSSHDIHTKFHKDWFRHSEVDWEHTHRHTDRIEIA